MSRWHTPDGPLHDFAGEAAERRSEAVDAMVEEWSHDEAEIETALLGYKHLASEVAYAASLELDDATIGKHIRAVLMLALTKRAEREIDA
jgi:hypothetical protein